MDTLTRFFATDARGHALLLQRVVLGAVILPHGLQKLLGWFGGYGLAGTMQFFTETMHIPAPLAFLVILGESFGALGLVLGLGTRLGAVGIALTMVGAVLTTHLSNGFFMNWFGTQAGEGFEYHLLALGLALPLAWLGAGSVSIDGWIARRLAERSTASRGGRAAAAA